MPVSNDYQDVVSADERGAQVLDRALSGGAMGGEATPASESRPGVGPWVGELPTDEKYDPELLKNGDHRNVEDQYRYWT
ncbi:MAG: TrmH family RNA methyltransferase, partial [Actinomycetaceae bacterium UMB1218B]|nr:TrmH family RNA methyltransferase [Actinomycetaceae bacterium UMB1218B]